jgi:hypothetical protein
MTKPLSGSARGRLKLVGAGLSVLVALAGALGMQDRVRLVDILTLFAGGMGAGVGLAGGAADFRAHRARPDRKEAIDENDVG